MSRSVDIWVGITDDTPAPPRVRARVFERCAGRCHRCGRKIMPADRWTLEHLIALVNGGRNAEDNMCLTCSWCLPVKNAEDAAIKAHGTQVRYRHLGIRSTPARPLGSGNNQHRATGKVVRWMDRIEAESKPIPSTKEAETRK